MREVRWCLVGGLVLVALAGCGRWFAEREPWRREAEAQCLKSGAVKEGPGIAVLRPIQGPGVCGADYPLKVAALGESTLLGFAAALRPPGPGPPGRPARGADLASARSRPSRRARARPRGAARPPGRAGARGDSLGDAAGDARL